jgi:hypothetical protein
VRQSQSHYDQIAALLGLRAFQRWRDDPDQPKRWTDVLEFFEADPGRDDAPERFRQMQDAVTAAMQSCIDRDNAYLIKNPIKRYAPIHIHELRELNEFLEALLRHFPQLAGGSKK